MEKLKNISTFEQFKDPEIKQVLEEFNFESLKSIFQSYARKTNIDPEQVGFVDRENILRSSDLASVLLMAGSFNPDNQEIKLTESSLRLASKFEKDKAAIVISTLIHEEVHALGHNEVTEHDQDRLFGLIKNKQKNLQTGFMEVEVEKTPFGDDPRGEKFRWFNEGMVDELAAEIYDIYLVTESPEPIDGQKSMEFIEGYPLARLFVQTLVDRVAEDSGVNRDLVWGSFIKLYIEEGSLLDEEIQGVMEKLFSSKFIHKLANIKSITNNPINTTSVFREVLDEKAVAGVIDSLKDFLQDATK